MTDHPRIAALKQYALEVLHDAQERFKQVETEFATNRDDPGLLTKLNAVDRELDLATDRLPLYVPAFGSEICPYCFLIRETDYRLRIDHHVRDTAATDDTAICLACGFHKPVPRL